MNPRFASSMLSTKLHCLTMNLLVFSMLSWISILCSPINHQTPLLLPSKNSPSPPLNGNPSPPLQTQHSYRDIITLNDLDAMATTLEAKRFVNDLREFNDVEVGNISSSGFIQISGQQIDDLSTTPLTHHTTSTPANLKEVDPTEVLFLRFYAYMTGASYCMSQNLVPKWNCGYPRCSNPTLFSSLSSNISTTLFDRNDTTNTEATHSKVTWNDDILAATVVKKYLVTQATASVGYIATNPALAQLQSTDDTVLRKLIVIVFRGTMSLKNLYFDLKVAQANFVYPGLHEEAMVHRGFWDVWLDVRAQVDAGIKIVVDEALQEQRQLRHSEGHLKKIHFDVVMAGHSLGGTTAVFCGLYLRDLKVRLNEFPGLDAESMDRLVDRVTFKIYTYGEPRIGNALFAAWVIKFADLPIHRITYHGDIVARLPPRTLTIPFPGLSTPPFLHHMSENFVTHDKSRVLACDESQDWSEDGTIAEDPNCSAGVVFLSMLSHLTYFDVLYGPWC